MNALFAASRYLMYRVRAYSAHGIHSPFVYEFITTLLRDDTPFYAFHTIDSLRSRLLANPESIYKTDYGTGGKSGPIKIQRIARKDILPKRYGQLLFRMVNHFKAKNILEMGTSLGVTTLYLASPSKEAEVMTLEGCPETAGLARANFDKLGMSNISVATGEFSSTLPVALHQLNHLDFLYIDGNHKYKSTVDYFNTCLPYCHGNTVLVFDDIHWSNEMETAWDEIRSHPDVSISIDLFKLGVVFLRSGVPKQHFTLKF